MKSPKTRSIVKYLLIIVIVYASFYVFLFGLRFVLGSEYPLVVVEGISMEPTLQGGDLLLVKGIQNKSAIQVRDIIIFYEPYDKSNLVVHRVISITRLYGQEAFRTMGDNNPIPDPWTVHESDVLGVVVGRVPAVGSAILVIQSPVAKVVTATILIMLIIVNVFYDEEKPDKLQDKTSL